MKWRHGVAVGCLAMCLAAGCSSDPTEEGTTSSPASSSSQSSPAATAPSTTVPDASSRLTGPPPLTVRPRSDSPALTRFDTTQVDAALRLSNAAAYYGVADPHLLSRPSAHADIREYAQITRLLSPEGLDYLTKAVAHPDNAKNRSNASSLALALYDTRVDTQSGRAAKTHDTLFDTPFAPRNYRATIKATVGLSADKTLMVVTGSCSVQIPGTRGGVHYLITLERKSFSYFISATPSPAESVGISGWRSDSDATYRKA